MASQKSTSSPSNTSSSHPAAKAGTSVINDVVVNQPVQVPGLHPKEPRPGLELPAGKPNKNAMPTANDLLFVSQNRASTTSAGRTRLLDLAYYFTPEVVNVFKGTGAAAFGTMLSPDTLDADVSRATQAAGARDRFRNGAEAAATLYAEPGRALFDRVAVIMLYWEKFESEHPAEAAVLSELRQAWVGVHHGGPAKKGKGGKTQKAKGGTSSASSPSSPAGPGTSGNSGGTPPPDSSSTH